MRLVYLSPVPWASFCQRPHKFVEWFHTRSGQEVLWIDPYPTRLPKLTDLRRLNMNFSYDKKIPAWLTVLKPWALPIEPLPGSGFFNNYLWRTLFNDLNKFVAAGACHIAIGKPSALALQVLKRAPDCYSIYDAMDNFPAGYDGLSRKTMDKNEQALTNIVNKILVSSTALQDRFKEHSAKMTLALNACAINSLPPINTLKNNTHTKSVHIIGYVGTIAHWFDWPLIFNIARKNPSTYVRLIGPVYSPPPIDLPDNIEILPSCDHETAIRAMQDFSIGLIPFKLSEFTHAVDPIKYYEYTALGLPVLSTCFGEMACRNKYPGVFLMSEHIDLKQLVETALDYQTELHALQKFRGANSWEVRFDACGLFPE